MSSVKKVSTYTSVNIKPRFFLVIDFGCSLLKSEGISHLLLYILNEYSLKFIFDVIFWGGVPWLNMYICYFLKRI